MNHQYLLAALLSLTPFSAFASADRNYDPRELIFYAEADNFVEIAEATFLADSTSQKEALLTKLKTTAERVARVYFELAEGEMKDRLDSYLGESMAQAKELENYFLFMGNAFVEEAQFKLEEKQSRDRTLILWSTVGGAALGLLGGGGYLYFQTKVAGRALSSRDYIVAAVAVAGGVSLGVGGGLSAKFTLPVDTQVENAKTFLLKYESGADYIKDIGSEPSGIRLGLLELEEEEERE